jgi:hypothetical protein
VDANDEFETILTCGVRKPGTILASELGGGTAELVLTSVLSATA